MRTYQKFRWGLLLVALVAYVSTATADETRGIRLTENSSISPFAELSITYDDNPFLLPPGEEVDDFYLDGTLGLSFIRQTESDNLSAQAWFRRREYFEFDQLNDDSWQERVEYVAGKPDRLQLRLKQRYCEVDDYEFTQSDLGSVEERREATLRLTETRTRRTQRDINDLSAAISRETRLLNLQIKGAYSAVSFDRSDYNLYDWEEYHADPFAGFRFSEKTMISLSGSIGRQESDNELNQLDFMRGLLGVRYTPSEKTRLTIGLGAQQHRVPDDSDLDTSGVYFDASGMWVATDKLAFQFYGRNEYQPTSAFTRNTKRVTQGSVGAVYDVTRRIYATLGPSYRADDYTAPINGIDARETQKGLQVRLVMTGKKRSIHLILKGRYEMFESNIQDDYNQLRLTVSIDAAI